FASWASNLVPRGTTNPAGTAAPKSPPPPSVYLRDRWAGTTSRASVAADGTAAIGASPSISADGRYVGLDSAGRDPVPGGTNKAYDVFVRDRWTGTNIRVSVASDGTQANGDSFTPAISADGRYIAFSSWASNLVPGDTNNVSDIFVRSMVGGGGQSFLRPVFASACRRLPMGGQFRRQAPILRDRAC